MTAKRALHLIAYDVGDAKRLSKMLHMIKEHATGGQKSGILGTILGTQYLII